MRLTITQQITIKGGQVAEAAITEAYVARFNKELENLKAKKVKVKLVKTRAERGKAYHGLQLDGVVDENAKIEQVLSEGEQIGSASCRGRVCKEVSVSGVAGYTKKQTISVTVRSNKNK